MKQQSCAHADRHAIDRGYQRLIKRSDFSNERLGSSTRALRHNREKIRQIVAGRKCATRSLEKNSANRVIGLSFFEGGGHRVIHRAREGILPFRPIHSYAHYAIAAADADILGHFSIP
jgi:hypothetical protein